MALILRKTRPAVAADTDPWLLARERYQEDLSADELKLFVEGSPENLFYAASNAQRTNEDRDRIRGLMRKIRPLVKSLNQYGKAVDVFSNASPSIMCPIWGSIRVVLQMADSFGKYLDKIVDMFARIGDVLPRLRDYERLFPDDQRLKNALVTVYMDVIMFCMDAKKVFRKGKTYNAIGSFKLLWKPFEKEFVEVIERFRLHTDSVVKEVQLAHMKEAKEERELERASRALAEKTREEENHLRLLEQLPAIDPSIKHRKLQKLRHPNTTTWATETGEFKDWLNMSESGCLWYYGIPGCGKTVLTAHVVDHLIKGCKTKGVVITYYYCDYSDPKTLKAPNLLGTILRQLLEDIKIPTHIQRQIFREYKYGRRQPAAEDLQEIILAATLIYSQVFVVIDGIDECEDQDRTDILSSIKYLLSAENGQIKAFIASREEVDIKRSLQSYPSVHVSPTQVADCIGSYITGTVHAKLEAGELVIGDPTLAETITTALTKGALGMFLWVSFQLEDLCEATSDREIRHILDDLPKDLACTYARKLRKIGLSRNGPEKLRLARKIFQWITVAKRPLFMEELKEAVAFEPSDTAWCDEVIPNDGGRLIESCGNLVRFDDEDQTIRLVHYTVQQFLTAASSDDALGELHFSQSDAERLVGETCIAYLSFSDFESQITKAQPKSGLDDIRVLETAFRQNTTYLQGISRGVWALWNRLRGVQPANATPSLPTINFERLLPSSAPPTSDTMPKKYRLLSYIVDNWVTHIALFSEQTTEMWAKLSHLALYKHPMFEFRPWQPNNPRDPFPHLNMFMWAVEHGNVCLLRLLLGNNIGPKLGRYANGGFGQSVIHQAAEYPPLIAIRCGHVEVLMLLVSVCGKALLFLHADRLFRKAIDGKALDIAEVLLQANTNKGAVNRALHRAVEACEGNEPMVQKLLDYGASVDACNPAGLTALHLAAQAGNEENVYSLINAGADVNAGDFSGSVVFTPVCYAAMEGHARIVKLLVDRGSRLTNPEIEMNSWYYRTIKSDHAEVVRILLESGKVTAVFLESGVREAIACGSNNTVRAMVEGTGGQLLYDAGKYMDTRSDWLRTAVKHGNMEIVNMLLRQQVDINQVSDVFKETALHIAASSGQLDLVDILLKHGADVNVKDRVQSTPLHAATAEGHEQVVKLLLAHGADTVAQDMVHNTPLHLAAMSGHQAIAQHLLDNGALRHMRNCISETPWRTAVRSKRTRIQDLLVG